MSGSAFYFLLLFNISGLLFVYFLLRRKLRRFRYLKKALATLQEEVEKMLVHMNQAADRNVSLVEDRLRSLKTLIAQADHRVNLLKSEQERNTRSSKQYAQITEQVRQIRAQASHEPDRKEEVQMAALKGMSVEEIARSFSMSVSEVELILSLKYPQFPAS